jgi:hypothetical protein
LSGQLTTTVRSAIAAVKVWFGLVLKIRLLGRVGGAGRLDSREAAGPVGG